MHEETQSKRAASDKLSEAGYASFEELSTAKLSGYFRPHNDLFAASSVETVRRSLHRFQDEVVPQSSLISFLGAGSYSYVESSTTRLENLLVPKSESDEVEANLLKVYCDCAEAITGMQGCHPGSVTLREAWRGIINWIVQSRPGRSTFLVAGNLHPRQRSTLKFLLARWRLNYQEVPTPDGVLKPAVLLGLMDNSIAAVIVGSPNYLGNLESTSEIGQITHQSGALFGVIVDLLSLCMVRTPSEYRANFCLADWRTLGPLPQSVGFHSWLWAVQSPEQLIDTSLVQEKSHATFTIARSLSRLDMPSLQDRFSRTWNNAHFLKEAFCQIVECSVPHDYSFFREFVVCLPCNAEELIRDLEDQGLLAGIALGGDGYPREWLLVSASEQHQPSDISYFLKAFKQALVRKSGRTYKRD